MKNDNPLINRNMINFALKKYLVDHQNLNFASLKNEDVASGTSLSTSSIEAVSTSSVSTKAVVGCS